MKKRLKRPMTSKEKGQFLIDNFMNEYGVIALNGVDLSDFEGNVYITNWKVKKSLIQSHQEVGGDLIQSSQRVGGDLSQSDQEVRGDLHQNMQKVGKLLYQNHQEVCGRLYQNHQKAQGGILQDEQTSMKTICQDPLPDATVEKSEENAMKADDTSKWNRMTPKEKGRFIIEYFGDANGKNIVIEDVDLSSFPGNVFITGWKVGGSLYQCKQKVGGDINQSEQCCDGTLNQGYQEVKGCLLQGNQTAGGNIMQDGQKAGGIVCQDTNHGSKRTLKVFAVDSDGFNVGCLLLGSNGKWLIGDSDDAPAVGYSISPEKASMALAEANGSALLPQGESFAYGIAEMYDNGFYVGLERIGLPDADAKHEMGAEAFAQPKAKRGAGKEG